MDHIRLIDISYEVRTIISNLKVGIDEAIRFVTTKYALDKGDKQQVKSMVEACL